jgi:hypothetical protein
MDKKIFNITQSTPNKINFTIHANNYETLFSNIKNINHNSNYVIIQSKHPWDELPKNFQDLETNLTIIDNYNNNSKINNVNNANKNPLNIELIVNLPEEKFLFYLSNDDSQIEEKIDHFINTFSLSSSNDLIILKKLISLIQYGLKSTSMVNSNTHLLFRQWTINILSIPNLTNPILKQLKNLSDYVLSF